MTHTVGLSLGRVVLLPPLVAAAAAPPGVPGDADRPLLATPAVAPLAAAVLLCSPLLAPTLCGVGGGVATPPPPPPRLSLRLTEGGCGGGGGGGAAGATGPMPACVGSSSVVDWRKSLMKFWSVDMVLWSRRRSSRQ